MTEKPKWAEQLNYWETSRSSPDVWLAKARKEILRVGGEVLGEAFGSETQAGRSAYMFAFKLDGEQFQVVWPVLPSKSQKEIAARRQAATMLYHDIKARCISSKVLGTRTAFFAYLMLPDGRIAGQLADAEMLDAVPEILRSQRLLEAPEKEKGVLE